MGHFSLGQAVDGFGQSIVVGIADRPDGGFYPGFLQAVAIADRDVLRASVAMVDQAPLCRSAGMDGLFQRDQYEAGFHGGRDLPAGHGGSVRNFVVRQAKLARSSRCESGLGKE